MPETNATTDGMQQPYPAEKARGGEIILKTTWSRAIFLTGLFGGLVVVTLLGLYLAMAG